MKKNILNIIIEGRTTFELNNKDNYITLSTKENSDENFYGKWIQINYENPEEILKALEVIKIEFGKINEINIIFNNQKLNMLSYQFDYEFLKNIYLYQTSSLIYLISLLIPFFSDKINIKLITSDFSYYQVHNKNWIYSISNFLNSLKKDISSKISIHLTNCK